MVKCSADDALFRRNIWKISNAFDKSNVEIEFTGTGRSRIEYRPVRPNNIIHIITGDFAALFVPVRGRVVRGFARLILFGPSKRVALVRRMMYSYCYAIQPPPSRIFFFQTEMNSVDSVVLLLLLSCRIRLYVSFDIRWLVVAVVNNNSRNGRPGDDVRSVRIYSGTEVTQRFSRRKRKKFHKKKEEKKKKNSTTKIFIVPSV